MTSSPVARGLGRRVFAPISGVVRKAKQPLVFSVGPSDAEYDLRMMRTYPVIFVVFFSLLYSSSVMASDKWMEVKSPHFTVFTDGGEKRGRDVALRLEQMRAIFGQLMGKKDVTLSLPLQVLAFRNNKGLKQVAPLWKGKPVELAGLYQKGAEQNFIALDLSSEAGWPVIFHEYAHLLLNSNLPPTPLWFDEGFAVYYSSIKITDKIVEVGRVPESENYVLQNTGSLMPVAALLNVQHESRVYNENGEARAMLYAQSWLVVHYIFDNQKLPALQQYMDLTMNRKMPIEQSLQQSFGMNFKQFDHEISAYRSAGHMFYYQLPAPPSIQSVNYSARAMEEYGALGAIADMHFNSPDYRDQAMSEYQQVLKLDPHNAGAHRGLGYAYLSRENLDAAEPQIAAAAASDSKDPMVHYYYAMLLYRRGITDPATRDQVQAEAQKAISLNQEMADPYNLLAICLNQAHDLPGAISNQLRAIQLKPRDEWYQANLAAWYLNSQKFDEAAAILARLRASDNPAIAGNASRQLEDVRKFQAYARGGSPPATLEEPGERDSSPTIISDPQGSDPAARPVAPKDGNPIMIRISGTIVKVICSGQGAKFLLKTEKNMLELTAPSLHDIGLIGAERVSCSWTDKKARVNYRPNKENNATGTVVILSVF